jgi:hypothetical protein
MSCANCVSGKAGQAIETIKEVTAINQYVRPVYTRPYHHAGTPCHLPDDCNIHCLYRPLEGIISTKNAATVSVNMTLFSFTAHHQQYCPRGG